MKKRLWWSMLFSSAALLVTSVTMFAQRPSVDIYTDPAGRAPSLRAPIPQRVPASYANGQIKAWEGFSSTNYLNRTTQSYSANFADIAVGPTDILTVVNRRIARWRNPNAMGAVAVVDGTNPSNEALLDAWLGEYALRAICPSYAQGGGPSACLFEHATVRYDQMHGRFVVLFTVIDTGLTSNQGGAQPTRTRRATWVMAVSRYATFVLGPGTYQNPNPNGSGTTATSDLFISPTPPGGSTSVTGGWNTDNWSFYFGDPELDTYGNINTATVEGAAVTVAGQGSRSTATPPVVTPAATTPFNCAADAPTTALCYMPTGARLGFDNDNVIVTSPVVNINLLTGTNKPYDPAFAFAGTRVRVIKKAFLYTSRLISNQAPDLSKVAKPAPGITMAGPGGLLPTYAAEYFDLYAMKNVGTAAAPQWVALNAAADLGTGPITTVPAYTLAPPIAGGAGDQTSPFVFLTPFCEPQHLRGRPAASFSTGMIAGSAAGANLNASANAGTQTSNAYIECTITNITDNRVYVQPISYVTSATNTTANTNPAYVGLAFAPQLVFPATVTATSVTGLVGVLGATGLVPMMQYAIVPAFTSPGTVPQANIRLTNTAAPRLFVGDARPQRVVFREGHLYDARTASSFIAGLAGDCQVAPLGSTTTAAPCLNSTVEYDIIQATSVGAQGAQRKVVLHGEWYNTYAWAPMYDVPANVVLNGQVSPINTFPWLEKLFVATTYPPLSLSDPRGPAQSTEAGGAANCQGGPTYNPSVPSTTNPVVYAGLYDMRCGSDAYDTVLAVRDPIFGNIVTAASTSGAEQTVSLSTRNGAAIDPNDGSLWNYGLYATRRFASTNGTGQWSTYVSNYGLTFGLADPYGNSTFDYSDVPVGHPWYGFVQIAKNNGLIAPPSSSASAVGLGTAVTRKEMAKLVMLSLMDETAITNFLNATGGCANSWSDVTDPACTTVSNTTGAASGWRYIEAMGRRGITKGCSATNDARGKFCPDDNLTRGQMAVFLVRAKMNNVFVTSLNGCPGTGFGSGIVGGTQGALPACVGGQGGDGFDLFVAAKAATSGGYFCDVASGAVPATLGTACAAAGISPAQVTANDEFYIYIQKLFELRISNGTTLPTIDLDNSSPITAQGVYSRNANITRGEVLVFVVRAFFL